MIELSFQTFARLCGILKELYGYPSVADFRSIGGGYITENFLLSDGHRSYFLKRYNTTDTSRIHDITVAYQRFARGGIPVIEPIKNTQEESCFYLDEAWWGVFPYVDGILRPSCELTLKDATRLGTMLARIHHVGQVAMRQDIHPITLWNEEVFVSDKHLLEYAYRHESHKRDVDDLAMQALAQKNQFIHEHGSFIAQLRPQNDCLIHGDFTHNNIFFDPDGGIKAIFDLDKACVAPRSYELARSVLIICFDHGWDEMSFALANAFLNAYVTDHPISLDEFRLGLHTYVANYAHMTWLEKKIILHKSARHESLLRSSHQRFMYLAQEFTTLTELLFHQ